MKAPRPGASRVQVDDTGSLGAPGLVRMPANDNVEATDRRIQIKLLNIVQDVDQNRASLRDG